MERSKYMSVQKVNARDTGRNKQVYDVIGIGFGPANIALAIAFEELGFTGTRLAAGFSMALSSMMRCWPQRWCVAALHVV